MKEPLTIINLLILISLSFTYGLISAHYQIFPFKQLQHLKNSLVTTTHNEQPNFSHYFNDRVSFFQLHNKKEYELVFIGDSLTDNAEWQDLFPQFSTTNQGIKGDTTSGVLERIDTIPNASLGTFIMIGINDLARKQKVKEIYDNYVVIVKELAKKQKPIYIQSTILLSENIDGINNNVMELNKKLKSFAKTNPYIHYIDINSKLSKNSRLSHEYSNDGQHLNGKGYNEWKHAIIEVLP